MISLNQPTLTTPRLTLRPWRQEDLVPFAAMNADPQVMRHFPKILTRQESDALADHIQNHFAQHAFGLFAIELSSTGDFLGFVGLSIRSFQSQFTPCAAGP
ncbi:MAG TPA: GNAT family N-acetyltransferase [Tepidisphaeraceae bacterium]|nr:GNAT family N-acetyltransferase [Tepidisphaeraceae bacterium]